MLIALHVFWLNRDIDSEQELDNGDGDGSNNRERSGDGGDRIEGESSYEGCEAGPELPNRLSDASFPESSSDSSLGSSPLASGSSIVASGSDRSRTSSSDEVESMSTGKSSFSNMEATAATL